MTSIEAGPRQESSSAQPPVLHPKITDVGIIRDDSLTDDKLPVDAGLSPNGKLIAYTTKADLRVRNVETGLEQIIVDDNVHAFSWSPAGDALAITRQTREASLWIVRVDGATGKPQGTPALIGPGAVNHAPCFSPDGQLVAYARQSSDESATLKYPPVSLAVASVSGGPIRTLASATELRVGGWTSDGSAVFYGGYVDAASPRPQQFRVSLDGGGPSPIRAPQAASWPNYVDPNTREVKAVFEVPAGVTITDWRGNDRRIGVRERHPGSLRVVSLVDGNVRELSAPGSEVGIPEWFPNGDRFAIMVRRGGDVDLLTGRADGSGARTYKLASPPRFTGARSGSVGQDNAYLRISPDGRFAAFLGNDLETIELLDLTSGRQQTLIRTHANPSAPEGLGLGPLAWTEDSTRIRYLSGIWTDELRGVREITLSGVDRVIRPLPRSVFPTANAWFPSNGAPGGSSPDSVVLSGDSFTFVPLNGDPSRALVSTRVRNFGALSPDGKTMALRVVNGRQQTQITLVSVLDGSTRVIAHSFLQTQGLWWDPNGQRLFALGREATDATTKIYAVPLDGTPATVIASFGTERQEGALAVSADGRFVAFTVADAPTATFVKLEYDLKSILGSPQRK